MSRAEERAKETYPLRDAEHVYDEERVIEAREHFVQGYKQAEKDYLQKLDYILSKINVDSHTDEELEDLYDCLCEIVKRNSVGIHEKESKCNE